MDAKIKLSKHIFGDLRIDSKDMVGIFGPRKFDGFGLSDEEIVDRIKNPVGTPSLKALAEGKEKVLIVTDDNTRLTPLSRLVPPVLSELHDAGIRPDDVTVLIGLGTHRPMTEDEIKAKFGIQLSENYAIINHDWKNPDRLFSMGVCDMGFEVIVNKLVREADLIISVGSVVPHATAGFSGGGKTIMPGICAEKTIEDTHWMALQYEMADIIGVFDNQVRRSIVSVCRRIGVDFIVNTILAKGSVVYDLVAGDVEKAHLLATEISSSVYGVPVPEKGNIVVAEAYPTDIDLRQAIKAICTGALVCNDGGVIILPAECAEGLAPQFPSFLKFGFSNPEKLYFDVEKGHVKEKLLAYTLVAIGRIISKKVRAILVSTNVTSEVCDHLGFSWAPNLHKAWNMANAITGKPPKAIVLKEAGKLLPYIHEQSQQ